jgi:hypothetical protein
VRFSSSHGPDFRLFPLTEFLVGERFPQPAS